MTTRGTDRPHLLDEALRSVTRAVSAAPKVTLLLVLLVTGASVALTVCYLGFKTDRADLIDPNAPFQRRWLAYTESFGAGSDIVAVVEDEDPDALRAALDDLGGRLRREPTLFTNVLYKIDPTALRGKGLQFLAPEQLAATGRRLEQFRPVARGNWELVRLESLTGRLAYQLADRNRSGGDAGPILDQGDQLADSLSAYLTDSDDFRSPWPTMLPAAEQFEQVTHRPIYLMGNSGKMGFLKAVPLSAATGFDGATAAIDRMRQIVAEVTAVHPGVRISLTGIPVLENDEMRRSSLDMAKASVISFVGVGLLLFLGFRGVRHPAMALVMLAIGLAWAFGFTTFSVGHLNILSVSFAAILIGLGIDFGIHYLSRYLEERQKGADLHAALERTSVGVGSGIITAATTTALAFFCATFTQFLGVAELGIIAGGGILLCALAGFLALPALIALADEKIPADQLPTPVRISWLRFGTSRFPLVTVVLSTAVIVAVGAQAFRFERESITPLVRYDHNLLNLQAEGLESVEIQKRIFTDGNDSLLFAVSLAGSAEEARALKARFEALPTVAKVDELATRLPQGPSESTKRMLAAVRAEVAGLPTSVPALEAPNPAAVGRALEQLFKVAQGIDTAAAAKLARKLDQFLNRFERLPFSEQASLLGNYQRQSTAALFGQFRMLAVASDPEPLTASDLPSELTSRFISPQGKWLLQIYPKEQVWEFEPLARFVADVRSVDADVTGTPLQNFEASRQIKASYETAAVYALCVICLVLLMDFLEGENKLLALVPPLVVIAFTAMTLSTRGVPVQPLYLVLGYLGMVLAIAAVLDFANLRDAAFAMLPPAAGGLMMFGVLALLHVDLNAANLIVLPLVLGIGVDNGVYVVHNYRARGGGRYTMDASTMSAILLTSLTTMIGFGSMMIAAHRGLQSVGLVLSVGVGCCLFVSLITLPALLSWLTQEPRVKRVKQTRETDDDLESATRPEPRQQERGNGQNQQKRRAA